MTWGRRLRTATAPWRPEALLGDLEHLLLGAVDELAGGLPFVVEDGGNDLGAGLDELTQERALPDDVRIGADIRGSGRIAGERAEIYGCIRGRLQR